MKAVGNMPFLSEELIIVVINGRSSLRQVVRVLVGLGFRGQDLECAFRMVFRTVSIDTSSNSASEE